MIRHNTLQFVERMLLTALLFSAPIYSQQQPTIISHLITPTQNTLLSGAIPNIGQTLHTVSVVLSDRPGGSMNCAGSVAAQIQGSFDGVIYYALPQITLIAGGTPLAASRGYKLYQATGLFPILRTTGTLNSNCSADVWYSGIVGGGGLSPLSQIYETYSLGVCNAVGSGLQGTCQLSTSVSASGQTTLITGNGTGGVTDIAVYAVEICNTTAAQTVTLLYPSTTPSNLNILTLPNMTAGQCYTEQAVGSSPVFTSATGNATFSGSNLAINLANATNVTIKLTYRFE